MDSENILTHSGDLYHWGIKGMRWGIRRYQNADGSLTDAGRKRYDDDGEAVKTSKKKSVKDMTDEELDRAIVRARKEDEYNRLRPEPTKKPGLMNRFVNDAVIPAAVNSGRKALEGALDKVAKNLLADKPDPNSIEALRKTYEKLDLRQKIDKLNNPDKYLTEEDKNKRQDRAFRAADREAQLEGYKDAADRAAKTRAAEQAANERQKTNRSVMNRALNNVNIRGSDPINGDKSATKLSQDDYSFESPSSSSSKSSTYSQKGGTREYVNPNQSRAMTVYNSPVKDISTSTVSSGRESVNSSSSTSLMVRNPTISNVPSTYVNQGRSATEKYMTYDEDDKFVGYWSAIRDDD